MKHCLLTFFVLMPPVLPAFADPGDPVALRRWPGNTVTLHSYWGLGLSVSGETPQTDLAAVEVNQSVHLMDSLNHILSRAPNQDVPSWQKSEALKTPTRNEISVQSVGNHAVLVTVDDCRVLFLDSKSDNIELDKVSSPELLVFFYAQASDLVRQETSRLLEAIRPHAILPIGDSDLPLKTCQTYARQHGVSEQVTEHAHNTLILTSQKNDQSSPRLLDVTDAPWKMPADLERLFVAMEYACSQSQEVFKKLSVEQMNFAPSNGTHTPRWNTEHMMGRQLLFFSQIYHAIDPKVPVRDLNPKQMPADYEKTHPDWDGKEEARQMQRVSDYCRRFAFLLDGIGLDTQAPGSRWPTLRALLLQMQRHYKQHTANTVKKFDLPDWPR